MTDKDEKDNKKDENEKRNRFTVCAHCTKKMTEKDAIPVYGEWEHESDIRRMVVDNGCDQSKVQSFDLSNYGFHTDGCLLAFAYDAKQTILDQTIPHHVHNLLKQRYRRTDLPINRKPALETQSKFRVQGVGLTAKQFELLETKYPFLTCVLRRDREFVESWPGDKYVMMTGQESSLKELNLQNIPRGILGKLVFNGDYHPAPSPITPATPAVSTASSSSSFSSSSSSAANNMANNMYVDLESTIADGDGDPDQDSDVDFDISKKHLNLDSDDENKFQMSSSSSSAAATTTDKKEDFESINITSKKKDSSKKRKKDIESESESGSDSGSDVSDSEKDKKSKKKKGADKATATPKEKKKPKKTVPKKKKEDSSDSSSDDEDNEEEGGEKKKGKRGRKKKDPPVKKQRTVKKKTTADDDDEDEKEAAPETKTLKFMPVDIRGVPMAWVDTNCILLKSKEEARKLDNLDPATVLKYVMFVAAEEFGAPQNPVRLMNTQPHMLGEGRYVPPHQEMAYLQAQAQKKLDQKEAAAASSNDKASDKSSGKKDDESEEKKKKRKKNPASEQATIQRQILSHTKPDYHYIADKRGIIYPITKHDNNNALQYSVDYNQNTGEATPMYMLTAKWVLVHNKGMHTWKAVFPPLPPKKVISSAGGTNVVSNSNNSSPAVSSVATPVPTVAANGIISNTTVTPPIPPVSVSSVPVNSSSSSSSSNA